MSTRPTVYSPFPFHAGVAVGSPQQAGGGGAVGIWYAYFEATELPTGGAPTELALAGLGMSGNAALFESIENGVRLKAGAIVQATAWGTVTAVNVESKWLGIQLDKAGTLLVRAHTAFNHRAANITYGGVLAAGDILRVVAGNETPEADQIVEGWISVIASPSA